MQNLKTEINLELLSTFENGYYKIFKWQVSKLLREEVWLYLIEYNWRQSWKCFTSLNYKLTYFTEQGWLQNLPFDFEFRKNLWSVMNSISPTCIVFAWKIFNSNGIDWCISYTLQWTRYGETFFSNKKFLEFYVILLTADLNLELIRSSIVWMKTLMLIICDRIIEAEIA